MRKTILSLAISLDSLIEGPNGEYDWCLPSSEEEWETFMNRIDAIFFGRKSYELVDDSSFPGKKRYVFSNTLKQVEGSARLINGDIREKVETIKNEEGKDIWLFGGAGLTTSFLRLGLIDELELAVHPIILGEGKPLFNDIKERTHLTLIGTKSFPSGLVYLRYRIEY